MAFWTVAEVRDACLYIGKQEFSRIFFERQMTGMALLGRGVYQMRAMVGSLSVSEYATFLQDLDNAPCVCESFVEFQKVCDVSGCLSNAGMQRSKG